MALGAVSATGVMLGESPAAAGPSATLESDQLAIEFEDDGSIRSLRIIDDLYPTEYVMNPEQTPEQANDPGKKYRQWLGNLLFSYAFDEGDISEDGVGDSPWKAAWTTQSTDARSVTSDKDTVTVKYADSNSKNGIKGFTLVEKYSIEKDSSLLWTQKVTNTSKKRLVIGDWGVPIPSNEFWNNGGEIYEERVVTHSYVGGHGSYVTLTRPSGQGSYLAFATDQETGTRLEYQDRWRTEEVGKTEWAWNEAEPGTNIKGLNVYYVHSMAAQKTKRGYLPSTSLELAPGESKTYAIRVLAVENDQHLRDTLVELGSLDIALAPGPVIPVGQSAQIAVRTRGSNLSVTATSRNDLGQEDPKEPEIAYLRDTGEYSIYQLDVERDHLGANDVVVTDTEPSTGKRRESVLQLYVIDDVASLIADHADFIVRRTQWTPQDDLSKGDVRLYTYDDWMMNAKDGSVPNEDQGPEGRRNIYDGYWGLGDDWGLTHAQFLAEKLVALPDADQVESLDKYLDVAVWKTLMGNTSDKDDPKYLVYDFWEQGKPGDKNTTPSYRGYAYPHVYNTFFSMYKVARQNPDLIEYSREPDWYLQVTYGIFKELYDGEVAYNWETGLMGELTTPELIAALRLEGMDSGADDIVEKMDKKYENFSSNTYPYGSEYSYDNTGEEAVYTLARMNVQSDTSNARRMFDGIVQKTEASRGREPVWYWYSVPVTNNGEAWWQFQYTAALAGYALDDYINATAVLEGKDAVAPERISALQRLNYAGKLACFATVNAGQISAHPDNIGASSWTYQAERGALGTLGVGGGKDAELLNGWRGMTGESDLGLWGALRTLSADVVTDDPIFGTLGYGADVRETGKAWVVKPRDGLRRRIHLVHERISVDARTDQISKATIARDATSVVIEFENVTRAKKKGVLEVSGLAKGTYTVRAGGAKQESVTVDPDPSATVPEPVEVRYDVPKGKTYKIRIARA
jgi:hypothetical protein